MESEVAANLAVGLRRQVKPVLGDAVVHPLLGHQRLGRICLLDCSLHRCPQAITMLNLMSHVQADRDPALTYPMLLPFMFTLR